MSFLLPTAANAFNNWESLSHRTELKMKTLKWSLAILSVGLAFPLRAAEEKPIDTFLEPEPAGADFNVQGEYVGNVTSADKAKHKFGAQVVALGSGKFRAVFLADGLPGDGWDGKMRTEIDGQTEGEQTVFAGNGQSYGATISGGQLKGKTDKDESFDLKKVLRKSPALGAKPPRGAVVLFDGSNAEAWLNGHLDDRKLLQAGTKTQKNYDDFTLHVEFRTPFKPTGRGQGRGNSGVYLQDRYEIQILDSFGLKGLNNECGGIYSQVAPLVNMCYPPLSWQTYDIDFQAARFDADGKKTRNAWVSVKHNGVLIHDQREIKGPTGGGNPEGPGGGPIQLQGHGNPVFFKNIWVMEKK